ncbi:MAG: hypothetical protein HY866_10885, partial [Chloroflexi bacterium]|nr:hypothetical protein [Chloroflexota bacterium]
QMMSAALVPWLCYGLIVAARRPSRRALLGIALPLAGIVLTHVPIAFITALITLPAAVMIPAWITRRKPREFPRRFGVVIAGLALGAALAAIFVLPMALELRYIRAADDDPETIAFLSSRFVQLSELFAQPRPVDLTDLTFQQPVTLGLTGALLGLIGLIALVIQRRFILAALLALLVGLVVFMMLDDSLDVWLNIPYFRQIRFPERLLRFGAIWLALLGGASLLLLPERWRLRGLAVALPLMLISALPQVYGSGKFVSMNHLTALDEIQFEIDMRIWGTTSYDEYDPKWGATIPRPDTISEPESYLTDPLRVIVYRHDVIEQFPDLQVQDLGTDTIQITAATARPVRFHQYYFPGWKATLDGDPVRVYPEDEMGLLTVDVPAGEHQIELHYAGTTAQQAGEIITLIALGIVLLILIPDRVWRQVTNRLSRRARQTAPDEYQDKNSLTPYPLSNPVGEGTTPPLSLRSGERGQGDRGKSSAPLPKRAAAAIISGVIVLALINEWVITPHTHWFRHESPPDNPAYMDHPVHQAFGGMFELLGYTLEEEVTAPGDWLELTLYWRPLQEITQPFRPRVQLVNLPVSEAWAVSDPFFPQGGVGYPLDRFVSDRHILKIPASTPPYMGHLSVQLVHLEDETPLLLPDGSDRLILDPLIRVRGSGSKSAQTLDYRLGGMVELRCASIEPSGDSLAITLYWHVITRPGQDLSVFVHGLDSTNTQIAQNDAPALGAEYPARYWQAGQTLIDHHTLPFDPAIQAVAIGLYTPDTRLTVTQGGQTGPDDRIILPVVAQDCTR